MDIIGCILTAGLAAFCACIAAVIVDLKMRDKKPVLALVLGAVIGGGIMFILTYILWGTLGGGEDGLKPVLVAVPVGAVIGPVALAVWTKDVDTSAITDRPYLAAYEDCKKFGITEVSQLDAPENLQRVKLIFKEANLTYTDDNELRRLFAECMAKGRGKDSAAQEKAVNALKVWEEQKYR